MEKLDQIISIPSTVLLNRGLSAATEQTMLRVLGSPGKLSSDCTDPSPELLKFLKYEIDIGPFTVSGLVNAVESLNQLFKLVKQREPYLYNAVKKESMLCIRRRKSNVLQFSNHSWGTAIDIYFGEAPIPYGCNNTQKGVILLLPYFNQFGWYWGAGFPGDAVDANHFEMAEETILSLDKNLNIPNNHH